MEDEVYCKSTYPQAPHWYPEERVMFRPDTKYKVSSRNEKYIEIISKGELGENRVGQVFSFKDSSDGKLPVFENYFLTLKELRKLKLKKINPWKIKKN